MENRWRSIILRIVSALPILLALILSMPASADDVLHIYNWNNYIGPQTLERFKRECVCRISYDTYGANDELLAKLAAGATGYDVLVPTGFAVEALIKQNALQPIDKNRLKNFGNLNPTFLHSAFDPDNTFSIPYAFTVTLLGYNVERMQTLGIPTDSWAALFEPKYLAKMRGRVTVLDDQRELMAAALKYLGFFVNDTDESHWRQAAEIIRKAKPYWTAFNNTSYIRLLSSGDIWLAQGYSSDMFQAADAAVQAHRGVSIGYSIPREGAVLALDNMVIPKSAPRPDLALRFIDFMLAGQNAAELSNMLGTGNPNRAAQQFINPAISANRAIFPDEITAAHLEQLRELDRRQRRLLGRLWTEIKLW